MDDADDKTLVSRSLNGDPRAFETLIRPYEKVLYNVALRMTNNAEDARDMTQTTFLKAYRGLRGFDPQHKFFSWVYRILINETLNHLKRRRPQQEVSEFIASSDSGPEAQAECHQIRQRVHEALLDLPPDQRQLVVLRHLLDMPYSEIQNLVGLPEKTIKWRLYEARQALGRALRKRGLEGL